MSIAQSIETLAAKVKDLKPIIETEEATKTAFIIPFISTVLGYDAPQTHAKLSPSTPLI